MLQLAKLGGVSICDSGIYDKTDRQTDRQTNVQTDGQAVGSVLICFSKEPVRQ